MLQNNMNHDDENMKNYYKNIRTSMVHYLRKVKQRAIKYVLRDDDFDIDNITKFKIEISSIKEILDYDI